MAIYTQQRCLWIAVFVEPLDDDPKTNVQEVRWDDEGIMYIVDREEGPRPSVDTMDEDTGESDQVWTKKYNFGDTLLGPIYREEEAEKMDLDHDNDSDDMEVDY